VYLIFLPFILLFKKKSGEVLFYLWRLSKSINTAELRNVKPPYSTTLEIPSDVITLYEVLRLWRKNLSTKDNRKHSLIIVWR